MSEYQFYEFQAVDRPLSSKEQAELRALSTRAEITAYRFTNVYPWGNFKGSPDQLMERYFDVHVEVARRRGTGAEFTRRLRRIREQNLRRHGLLARMNDAGLSGP